MPTTLRLHGHEATDIHRYIELLIHNLVNIKDTTGRFLLKLDDGRIIDTKGQTTRKLSTLWKSILTRPRLE
jgi:unsaturated rhamnogalacturonyl hydrolase